MPLLIQQNICVFNITNDTTPGKSITTYLNEEQKLTSKSTGATVSTTLSSFFDSNDSSSQSLSYLVGQKFSEYNR